MTENQDSDKRIEHLENLVENLQDKVAILEKHLVFGQPQHKPESKVLSRPLPKKKKPHKPIKSEDVLNKVGIGLLVLGLAFFFKYGIDQGWFTPIIRIGFGVVLGTLLLGLGLRIGKKHVKFGNVLQGGSIATYYVTIFAAFQLYGFIPYIAAFLCMVAITILAFVLSVKQSNPVLAIIGTLGGFATPFILYTGSQNLPGLVVYTCLILVCTSMVYFFRGWRLLLLVSALGAWLIMFSASYTTGHLVILNNQITLQIGVIFMWLLYGGLAIAQEVFANTAPRYWIETPYIKFESSSFSNLEHVLAIGTPFIAFTISHEIWSMSNTFWGWIAAGGSFIYAVCAFTLHKKKLRLSYTHSFIGLMLITTAFVFLFEGNTQYIMLAAEATLIHIAASRLSDGKLKIIAHTLFIAVGVWLAKHLWFDTAAGIIFVNSQALCDLAVIIMIIGVSMMFRSKSTAIIYQIAGNVAVLSWFLKEFTPFTHGQAYTTISWGIYAIVLFVDGILIKKGHIRTFGLVLIYIVIGKLILIDLSTVTAIWRVLLFMGFGTILLFLSYYFPKWINPLTGFKEKQ